MRQDGVCQRSGPPGRAGLELNGHECETIARILRVRRNRVVETVGDTTEPDEARRQGAQEIAVIDGVLEKLRAPSSPR